MNSLLKFRSFLSFLLLFAVFVAAYGFFTAPAPASAGVDDALFGAMWTSNAGWISANCVTENTCNNSAYGIDIDVDPSSASYGSMSGYAWSQIYGWIDFSGGSCGAGGQWDLSGYTYDSANPAPLGVNGWAEIVSAAQDSTSGVDPCVSFSGTTKSGDSYQVQYDPEPDAQSVTWNAGYGWNGSSLGTGLGWIDFSGVYMSEDSNLDCYINGNNCPVVVFPEVDITTGFSGNCGDNPAKISWTTSDIKPGTCQLFINGSLDGSVGDSGSYPITTTSSTQTIQITCGSALGATNATATDTIGLSCSTPQCDPGSGDEDGDGFANDLDSSCHTDCDETNPSSYDPSIMSESGSCVSGNFVAPIYKEI